MTLDRRHATKLILTGSLAAPALLRPTGALANIYEDREHSGLGSAIEWALLTLILTSGQRPVLRNLVLLTAVGAVFGYRLDREVRRRAAVRANARGMPFFGKLLDEPVADRVAKAELAGNFYILGPLLVLVMVAAVVSMRRTTIVHREHEYMFEGRPKKIKMDYDLGNHDFGASKPVGRGYVDPETGEIIGLIPPHRGIRAPA